MNSNKSRRPLLRRLFRWPKRIFNTRTRLAFAMSLSVFTMVMLAQVLHIVPDPNQPRMDARKLQTETLALAGSALAEANRNLHAFEKTLTNTVDRAPELISIGLRNSAGKLEVQVGDHERHWEMPAEQRSNDRFMFVPIFRGKQQIAQLEMCYTPLTSFATWLQAPVTQLGLFIFVMSFVLFNFLLRRTLNQLDPRGAVPRRVREALDNMAEGLLILDREGHIMLANSKFGALVGVEPEKLTAVRISKFEWQANGRILPWTRSLEEQTVATVNSLTIVDAAGKTRTFSVSAAPVLGHKGTARGVMVTFDDITALEEHKRELIKARNEADAANQAKSNFLSRMSHEIRTPMNAIIGYTDILQQGALGHEEQVRYLTTIQSSGEHLLTLINDILDLSKVEAGQLRIERRATPLVPLLKQAIDTLQGKASERQIYLRLKIDGKIPRQIETDETRLRQVLINTLGNAIKFTSDGGVTLTARTIQQDGRAMIQFDVADTGIGIPQSALATIFDPFTQADDSVTRRFGGTGLGLAICKQLSQSLGGDISVRSQEGVGSTFSFTIDPGALLDNVEWVTTDSLKQTPATAVRKTATQPKFRGGHILIVDDAKANRDLAAVMSKRLGVTHDLACNGQEALDKIAENKYDVVLMDMSMPVMDGMAATMRIREQGLDLPVIALTALAVEDERRKCLESGCNSFVAKPIRMESLFKALAEFLELDDATAAAGFADPNRAAVADANSDAAATKAKTQHQSSKNESSHLSRPSDNNDIEASLASTLASLGLDAFENENLPKSSNSTGGLELPEFIESTLPPDPEFTEILIDFLDRLPAKLSEFEDALRQQSMDRLRSLAHWLVGAAATVGLDAFVAPAREMEFADKFDPDRVGTLIIHFKKLCERIRLPNAAS